MKRFLIILFVMILILTGCNDMNKNENASEAISYNRINAKEAKAIIDSENVIILDVRTQEEFNDGHIENAVLLPVTEISSNAENILTNKDAKILVYCRSGNRSATATRELIKLGYKNVYDFGGINSWPYEVVK